MHSGRLESTQEARVALGYDLVHLLSTLPRVYARFLNYATISLYDIRDIAT